MTEATLLQKYQKMWQRNMLKFHHTFSAQVYDLKGTGIYLNLWSKKTKNTWVDTYQCFSSKKNVQHIFI